MEIKFFLSGTAEFSRAVASFTCTSCLDVVCPGSVIGESEAASYSEIEIREHSGKSERSKSKFSA